ncbi:flavin monoamine oxidase family protein [Streptacidiphilus carbonis]|jgi:monoamine oxidase|uniref:flavin monoamine oxidase family protein n=1 Tax=Streptacidiphilus carbonis TaxID=105422 RepID=UPI0005AB6202|nr:FAD-dependent oxidoreductase [Streptacidiphilus carbonis]
MPHRDSHDVIVVGAGASGLATATALHAAGLDTLCLEARDRVGGRLLSVPTSRPGRALDLGATWFWDGEQRVRDLAERSGTGIFDQHLAGDTVFQDAGGIRRLPGNLIDAPARRFADGAQSLSFVLAASLPSDALRLSTPVTEIRAAARGGLAVRTPTGPVRAEHVVLALPPALAVAHIDFGDALPDDLVRLARSTPVWMGAVVKVVARYRSAFWRQAGLAGAGISRVGPLQELHDMSGPDGDPAALFGFAPAQALRPNLPRAVTEQLTLLFGQAAASPEALHVQDWSQERWTSPPHRHRLQDFGLFGHALYQRPALDGRLHWASTETAAEHAGHIEGALAAAERAATAVLSAAAAPAMNPNR